MEIIQLLFFLYMLAGRSLPAQDHYADSLRTLASQEQNDSLKICHMMRKAVHL
ncbi:MAG: hypothetical protein R3C61_10410 [Bacteroidia bacterium]